MPQLNWEIIGTNLSEGLEELQALDARLKRGDHPEREEFQIAMQHAYHHLNFAWNIRHEPTSRYANLTDEDFERWGKFPSDLHWEDA